MSTRILAHGLGAGGSTGAAGAALFGDRVRCDMGIGTFNSILQILAAADKLIKFPELFSIASGLRRSEYNLCSGIDDSEMLRGIALWDLGSHQ